MSLFTGTVEYYRRFRPGIPNDVISILDRATTDSHPRRLLDIGTGTGLVVQALLDKFDDIIATDNDPDMLAAAEHTLRPLTPPTTRLRFTHSPAENFTPPPDWLAHLVTICRTFHWLDQHLVLQRLNNDVAPDGAVAIFGDTSFWTADNDWKTAIRNLIQTFLGTQRRAGTQTFTHHNTPYSDILRTSPFSDVEEHTVPVHRIWTQETILGYLYSTSFAAPYLFGKHKPQFEQQLTATLNNYNPDNTYPETTKFTLHIARRP